MRRRTDRSHRDYPNYLPSSFEKRGDFPWIDYLGNSYFISEEDLEEQIDKDIVRYNSDLILLDSSVLDMEDAGTEYSAENSLRWYVYAAPAEVNLLNGRIYSIGDKALTEKFETYREDERALIEFQVHVLEHNAVTRFCIDYSPNIDFAERAAINLEATLQECNMAMGADSEF